MIPGRGTTLKGSNTAARRGHAALERHVGRKNVNFAFVSRSESDKVAHQKQQLRRQLVTSARELRSSRCDICLFKCVNTSGNCSPK